MTQTDGFIKYSITSIETGCVKDNPNVWNEERKRYTKGTSTLISQESLIGDVLLMYHIYSLICSHLFFGFIQHTCELSVGDKTTDYSFIAFNSH